MTNNVLFITSFKDLGREKWLNYERSVDQYITWFKSLSVAPIRLICFCEKDIEQRLQSECNFYNIYPYDEENSFCKFIDKENEIMNTDSFKELTCHRKNPEVNKPGYNNVNHNKIFFINKAKKMFPKYTHYAWIDFGYIRNNQVPEQLDFTLLGDKIIYHAPQKLNIQNIQSPIEALKNENNQALMTSSFICPTALVEWFFEKYSNMVFWYYQNNLVDGDQEIVKQIIKTEYEKFEIIISEQCFQMLNCLKTSLYIDAVIPTCLKDINTLEYVINGLKKNITNIRNIYVLCHDSLKNNISFGIFVDESIFPFSIQDVNNYVSDHGRGKGWWFQQLLKLYSYQCIEGISSNILIVDSETIFYNKYTPIENNIVHYAVSNEINNNYRDHIKLLLNDININVNFSGICHQMLFQTHVLQNLFDRIELQYNMPFWKVMLEINKKNNNRGYSEYDLYLNFALSFHKNTIKLTNDIKWDISSIIETNTDYTYLTCHSHLRGNNYISKNEYFVDLSNLH
jgi:hypothetical protein